MKMLFATDGSAGAAVARDFLLTLPFRERDHIVVLGVPVYGGMFFAGDESTAAAYNAIAWERDYVEDLVRQTRETFATHHIEAKSLVRDGAVAETILDVARETGASLIVLGSRGLGRISGALIGSVARAVARHSSVPVLVVRDRRVAPKRILAAVDGSDDSKAALDTLSEMPLPKDLDLTLLHVVPDRASGAPLPEDAKIAAQVREAMERADRDRATRVLAHATSCVPAGCVTNAYVEEGHAVERILAKAHERGSDLILLGARGTTLAPGFLQGSVADRVLADAPCAVLVAKAKSVAPRNRRAPEPVHVPVAIP